MLEGSEVAGPVDGGDAVVAGVAGGQADVGVGGGDGERVAHMADPALAAVHGDLDAVAGDVGPAVAGRRGPVQVNGVPAAAGGAEVPRGFRNGGRLGGGEGDAGGVGGAGPVDGGDAVVAGVALGEAAMEVGGGGGDGVGDEVGPVRACILGDLDAVAGDRGPAVAGRRGPVEPDGFPAAGGGGQGRRGVRGRERLGRVGGGVGVTGGANQIDGGDAVVAGVALGEAAMEIGGGGGGGDEFGPRSGAAVGRDLDAVAGDRGPAVAGRRGPVEPDGVRAAGGGGQGSRGARFRVGGREGGIGGGGGAGGVDGGDAVVAGGAGVEPGVRVGRGRGPGILRHGSPGGVAVGGPLDLVAADVGPAIAGRRAPVEPDGARAAGGGAQGRRWTRNGCRLGSGEGDVGEAGAAEAVDGGDAVVAGVALGEALMGIGGGGGVGVDTEVGPAHAVGGDLDPVAGDVGPAVAGRRAPVEPDGVRAAGGGG